MTQLDQLALELSRLGLIRMKSGAERIDSRFGTIDQHWHIFEWSGGSLRIGDDVENGLSCQIARTDSGRDEPQWYSIFHDTVPGFSRFVGDEAKEWLASVPNAPEAYAAFLRGHVEALLKQ